MSADHQRGTARVPAPLASGFTGRTLHRIFSAQALRTPDAIALTFGGQSVTYRELDAWSDALARRLRAAGVGPNGLVGVLLEPSPHTVVAILGVLKAGGAYLPLDPAHPADRLAFVLSDAQVVCVVTDEGGAGHLPGGSTAPQLRVDDRALRAEPAGAPEDLAAPSHLAYVIYTSGSTGRPKGCLIQHDNVVRLFTATDPWFRFGPEDVWTLFHSFAFDFSVWEIWGALLYGGRLVIVPWKVTRDPDAFHALLRAEQVTVLNQTPSAFQQLQRADERVPASALALRLVIFGGEALDLSGLRGWFERHGDARPQLVNMYGITETTVHVTYRPLTAADAAAGKGSVIGVPIPDLQLHLLGPDGAEVAAGAEGEIHVGGAGVARGYLSRPELTAARFVPDPFSTVPGARLYRSGDLARRLPDGDLEYRGRIDDQVKIGGHRIELGEIESALSSHPDVRQAVATVRDDGAGGKRLVAYAVPRELPALHLVAALRERAREKLPKYMMPSAFVLLERLPINVNGKVDRPALPPPPRERPALGNEYVAPATPQEQRLAALWEELLGVAPVGAQDSFFDLGGSSLLAVRLVERLRQEGLSVPVVRVFELPRLAELARTLAAPARSLAAPAARRENGGAIAIIGMAGRFPGAPDVEAFWQNLVAGRDAVTFFSDAELDAAVPPSLRADPAYVKARGVLDGCDRFDAAFFGMTPKEAEMMDPQHRVLLELSWEALERAGHTSAAFPGAIGIFAGKHFDAYYDENVRTRPDLVERFGELNTMIGNDKQFIATKIAHKLDLTGPALSVHTACSTSLVAVCMAVQSLRSGECDMALAGGAAITVPVKSGYLYQEGGMLSRDGRTRSFDAAASGTTFNDGAALVVLRRLEDAVADGDHVFAVIRGAALNNDGGRRASYSAPSVDGQAAVIARALADAGVPARSISYVEAHGTATPLGDPIEVEALTRAFRQSTPDTGFCAIGSVKSNVGHLTAAAGAAGLIKTALALHHRVLPGTVHFERPNPHIDFASSPFRVQARLEPWHVDGAPRRAGVSSFGVGGTNAHVIVEEAPPAPAPDPAPAGQLIVLSARTPEALDAITARLRQALQAAPASNPGSHLADVAYTLQLGRHAFAHRRFLAARDLADAVAGLDPAARRLGTRHATRRDPPVAFLFPGQGAQHVGMARTLYETEPVFRAALDRCAEALRGELDRDLRAVIHAAGDAAGAAELLKQTAYTQPALFAVEWALAELWASFGVVPRATAGHSVGEFVSAAMAGVMDPEDAIRLVAARGRLMQEMPPGAMLSVGLPAEALGARLRGRPALSVAGENAPALCVVAGPAGDVAALQQELEGEGVAARVLVTSHAFHSPMMDPVVPRFEALVRQVPLSAPRTPFVSTATGTWITEAQATDPGYWAAHLRATVRFAAAARTLLADPETVLLEVGPRATLCAMVRRQLASPAERTVVPSQADTSEGGADRLALLSAAGQLWAAGVSVDFAALHPRPRRRVVLPTYPFERRRHWVDPAAVVTNAPPAVRTDEATSAPAAAAVPSAPVPPAAVIVEPSMPQPSTSPSPRLDAVRALFEEVTGIDLAQADPAAAFLELGLDSLSLTQAALQLGRKFGVKITFRQLMEQLGSLGAVAAHLDAQLPPLVAPAAPAPAPAPTPTATLSAAPAAVATATAATVLAAAPLAAAPALPPVPAMTSFALPPGVAAGNPALQLIEAQLRIMSQQLAVLGAQVALPGTPAPAVQPAAAAPQLAPAAPAAQPAPIQPAPTTAAPAPVPAPAPAPALRQAQGEREDASVDIRAYDAKKAFGAIARIHTGSTELSPLQRARLDALIRRYNTRTRGSKQQIQENRAHLADPRVVNGFKPILKELTYPIVVQRSRGARLWDLDGNEYVDAICGFGSCFFGWQPDFVVEAVKRQIDAGYAIGPMSPLAGEVAKLVCEMTGMDRAAFCNTGSEAVLGCMRAARTVTGRSTIALFTGSYHGIFDEVLVRGTKKLRSIPAAPGILPGAVQDVLVLDYGTPESLEILRSRASELAAVLVEPVQSRRCDFQPREFLHEVRAITERSGTALIFDEVVNGFRVAPGGAQEFFGVRADLTSYGKVIGGGYPIGVIAGRKGWADALDGGFWQFGDDSTPPVGVTYFAGTFCRFPLGLAAAKAVLLHLKEKGPGLQQEVAEKAARVARELNAFFQEVQVPIEIRQFSSLWKTYFTREDLVLPELLFIHLRERGVHILDGFPCFMTTAHEARDVDHIVRAFKESVAELQEAGFLPAPPPKAAVADASKPPVPGARLGRDPSGKPTWYVPDPDAPGKFRALEPAVAGDRASEATR